MAAICADLPDDESKLALAGSWAHSPAAMRLFLLALILFAPMSWAETGVPQSRAEIGLNFAPLMRKAAPAAVNIHARCVAQAWDTPLIDNPFLQRPFDTFGQPDSRVQNSAIPANLVRAFVHQARDGRGQFERPWAGMSGQSVNQDIAETLGMGIPEGVVITDLHEDSPFARTGFEVGDVITAVEGVPVNSPSELAYRMSVAQEPDVLVDYVRRGNRGSVLVSLTPPPDDPPRAETELQRDTVLPGMQLLRINPAVIAEYGLPLEATGVLVSDPGQLGARVGLRSGDVIRLINGTRVDTPQMVRAALSRPGQFRLAVLRGSRSIVLSFRT